MRKRVLLAILAGVMAFTFTACNTSDKGNSVASEPGEITGGQAGEESVGEPAETGKINVATLKGPTGIGLSYLMEKNEQDGDTGKYNFLIESMPDAIVGKLTSGEIDAATVPTNLAASLYNKTSGGIQIAALVTLGVLYIVENGDTVNSIEDLRGQTIYATGQGTNTEYVLNYLLEQNGMTPGTDVTVEFLSAHDELATLMASGEALIGMLPEPHVSNVLINNENARVALNLNELWNETAGDENRLTMSTLVVRKEFAESNKETLDSFLQDYKESVDFVHANVSETAQYCEKFGIIAKSTVAEMAIPKCNITFISGEDMQPALTGYLTVLFEANPQSVGGKLPEDDIYYK